MIRLGYGPSLLVVSVQRMLLRVLRLAAVFSVFGHGALRVCRRCLRLVPWWCRRCVRVAWVLAVVGTEGLRARSPRCDAGTTGPGLVTSVVTTACRGGRRGGWDSVGFRRVRATRRRRGVRSRRAAGSCPVGRGVGYVDRGVARVTGGADVAAVADEDLVVDRRDPAAVLDAKCLEGERVPSRPDRAVLNCDAVEPTIDSDEVAARRIEVDACHLGEARH